MKENIVKTKSFDFAIQIVNIYKHLTTEKKEYILSKQILRSGTSVGAMIREAEHAISKADFKYKLSIAQKEINETIYWLDLLRSTDYLTEKEFVLLNSNAIEIIKLLTSIIKSTKANMT